jgi:cell division protein FtsL
MQFDAQLNAVLSVSFCYPPFQMPMSTSLIIATILVAGWNLTLTVAALLTGTGVFQTERHTREMSQSLRSVRAEVGTPDLDARTEAWKRDRGMATAESVQSRVAETPREVTMSAPYAEASVTVTGDEGREERWCSLCMN